MATPSSTARWSIGPAHSGVELREIISHKYHLSEVAIVLELTQTNLHLPLDCLQGGI